MATPSGFYTLEEITTNGFTYKRTVDSMNNVYPFGSNFDNTIVYTMPSDSSFRKISPLVFPYTSNTPGQSIYNHYQTTYYNSSAHTSTSWSTIGGVLRNQNADYDTSFYWVFYTDMNNREYWFNGGQYGNDPIGNGSALKLITDFDVEKVVFGVDIRGFSAANFNTYLADHTTISEESISLEDLIAHPENYKISRSILSGSAYWSSSTNAWISGAPMGVRPVIDSSEIKGFPQFHKCLSGDMNTAGINRMGINRSSNGWYVGVQNYFINTSSSGGYPYRVGCIPTHLSNDAYYAIGATNETNITSYKTSDELIDWLENHPGVTSDESTPRLIYSNGFTEIYGYDSWSTAKNYNTAPDEENHFNSYGTMFSAVVNGEAYCKFLATIGCYFCTTVGTSNDIRNYLNNNSLTPESIKNGDGAKIALGEMTDGGLTTGRWIVGEDIGDYDGINKGGSVIHPSFDPNPPAPTPSDDDDIESMGFDGMSCNVGGPAKYYIMSYSDIHHLIGDFNTHAEPGTSISNNIISCYVNALDWNWSTGSEPIEIYSGGAQTAAFTSDINYDVLTGYNARNIIGSIDVPRMTNTFYDFAPYSTYEVYVPFCGWVALPDTVAGRNIKIYFETDEATCGCKGRVFFVDENGNGVTVAEITGSFGAPCPIQVIEGGLYKGAMLSNGLQVIGGIASGVMGGASGSGVLAVGGLSNAMQGLGNCLVAGNTNYGQTIGRAGDASGLMCAGKPYLKITYPPVDKVVNNNMFAHTVGYLCNTIGQLSNFHGFTVCANPHIHISATSTEKEEIKQLLEQGVILP